MRKLLAGLAMIPVILWMIGWFLLACLHALILVSNPHLGAVADLFVAALMVALGVLAVWGLYVVGGFRSGQHLVVAVPYEVPPQARDTGVPAWRGPR